VKIFNHPQKTSLDYVPACSIKMDCEFVWSWGFVRFHGENDVVDFFFRKRIHEC
jgi:hypothetical protein